MKRILLFFLLFTGTIMYGQKFSVTGRVFSSSGEPVVGALVSVKEISTSTLTNNYGYFNIYLPQGNWLIEISHLSYKTKNIKLHIKKDTILFIYIEPKAYNLDQVSVIANQSIISTRNHSVLSIPVKRFNKLPVLLGDKDLFKGLQTLPGIQPGAEGTNLLNIRGGSPDQNLVLIDDMPLSYVSHLFGFFSTFNSEAVKSLKVYKGAFPARYNDMASSVVDIVMKDGDMYKRHFSIAISPISFSASVDGYLVKNKITLTMFYRRSFIDVLFDLGRLSGMEIPDNYKFYDLNSKLRIKINKNNTLYFSFFNGQDFYQNKYLNPVRDSIGNVMSISTEAHKLYFGNSAISTRWFSILSKKLSMINVLYYSSFNYANKKIYQNTYKTTDSLLQYFDLNVNSLVNKVADRLFFTYFLNPDLKFNFGINVSYNNYMPKKNSFYLDNFNDFKFKKRYFDTLMRSAVISPFIAMNYSYKSFNIYMGINSNNYLLLDTSFYYIEPRIRMQYFPKRNVSFQLSYSLTHQQTHILRSSAINMPSDLYLSSNKRMPPIKSQIGDFSINWNNKHWSVSLSFYYKYMEHLVRFLPGTDILTADTNLIESIDYGLGYSYGLEFLIIKHTGKLTGWLSYTFSRSFRKFDVTNFGQIFRYRYDRPHILAIVGNYQINPTLSMSLLWTFYSGSLVTIPTQTGLQFFPNFPINEFFIDYYTEVNNIRTPPYHRLDIAFNYHRPGGKSYWSFGIYNVYNRLNPTYLEPSGDGTLTGISLFPILPFVSYRLALEW